MGLRANFWKILRSGDVIALVELLFLPWGNPLRYIYELRNLQCFNINGVFLEQRLSPFRSG